MADPDTRTVNRLRALVATPEDDSSLLELFLERGDADAFAELVRRHGPLVLGACRRVLGPGPDAEDAFQAAFLVLARRAGSVRNARSVGSWLFGVARFAALRARDRDRRRRTHEARAAQEPRPETAPDLDLLAALDEELQRLPDRYRAPLVTCFLQGRTQEEAAKELGCSLSTLRRRLEQGQELLRRRLTGRRAVPAVGALLVGAGGANVSATVVETATALVVAYISGGAKTVPAAVLAEGVLAMMGRTKLQVLFTTLAFVVLTGGGIAWQLAAAQQPAEPVRDMLPPGVKAPAPPTDIRAGAPVPSEKLKQSDKIKPGDKFTIRGENLFEVAPLDEIYEIDAKGNIDLGPRYGEKIKIDGLTLKEAEDVLRAQIRLYARKGEVSLTRVVLAGPVELEQRVRQLEKEVKELRGIIEDLRAKKP